jgi:hypothetical protein
MNKQWCIRLMFATTIVVSLALFAGLGTSPPVSNVIAHTLTTSTSGLHVSGNHLVNSSGQTVTLHGVTRASWENDCASPWGITHDGPADQSEVTALQSWHVTVVRIAPNEGCWLGINGLPANVTMAQYRTDVTNYVNLLTSNNVVVVITLAWIGPGTTPADATHNTPQYPMPDNDHAPAFWSSIANTFKGNSRVLFEPFNEPHDPPGGTLTISCWRYGGASCSGFSYTVVGMQSLLSTIRNALAFNPVIMPGLNWESDISQLLGNLPSDTVIPPQVLIGWHSYGDLSCGTMSCWQTTIANIAQSIPVFLTEGGEFDCSSGYISQLLPELVNLGVSFELHTFAPWGCSSSPALISDWNFTPTQTYGSWYQSYLQGLPSSALIQPPNPTPSPTPHHHKRRWR